LRGAGALVCSHWMWNEDLCCGVARRRITHVITNGTVLSPYVLFTQLAIN
jgi:hypothetical protein